MSHRTARRHATTPARRRATRPAVEGLEGRLLLFATNGGAWTSPALITYSFAPDGTNVGGSPSTLFQRMSNLGISQSAWQQAFKNAAAYWEGAANINLIEAPDDGSQFGVNGNQQGDPRFGDIRIGGTPLINNSALACDFLPPPMNGGTLAGDMIFNTSLVWGSSGYDIQTVAIHEFGHALGLDHSSLSYADMYYAYNGLKQSLTADDIAGIQAVYGPRKPDQFDAAAPNNSITTATNISSLFDSQGQITLPNLDISSNGDIDYFHVYAPANSSGTFTVTMQSSGLSSLSPVLNLFAYSNGRVIASIQASAPNSYGSTVTAQFTGVPAGQEFYISTKGTSVPSNIGAYALLINAGTGTMNPIPSPVVAIAQQADQGGGSSGLTADSDPTSGIGTDRWANARALGSPATDEGSDTVQVGSLSGRGDFLLVGDLPAAAHADAHPVSNPATPPTSVFGAVDSVLAVWEPGEESWVIGRRRGGR